MLAFFKQVWERLALGFWLIVIAAFGLVVLAISVIVTIPYLIYQRLFRRGVFEKIPEEVMADFNAVVEALEGGDTAFLDDRLAADPDFVNGVDGFLNSRWVGHAVDMGTPETVAWFLNRGVDVDLRDECGECLLECAIEREINHENQRRADPAMSMNSGVIEILTLLLDAGADVNLPSILKSTPLHHAAVHGGPDVVQLLLDRGADPLACDAEYMPATPIHRAQAAKRHDIAELMKAHVARGR